MHPYIMLATKDHVIYLYTHHALVTEIVSQIVEGQCKPASALPKPRVVPNAQGSILLVDVCSVKEWREVVTEWRALRGYGLILAPRQWATERSVEALQLGASGIVLFSANLPSELPHALQSIARGQLWMSRNTLAAYVQKTSLAWPRPRYRLTLREEQIVALMMEGLPNKQIAEILRISLRTVKFHVSNLLHKNQVPDRKRLLAKFPLPELNVMVKESRSQ